MGAIGRMFPNGSGVFRQRYGPSGVDGPSPRVALRADGLSGGLRGSRVELRPLDRDDFDAWRRLWLDNAEVLQGAELGRPRELDDLTASPEGFAGLVDMLAAAAADGVHYTFGVHSDEGLVGQAELGGIAITGPLSAQFAVLIDERHAGKELSQEVFVVLCRFAFDELALHRVEVAVQLDNEASRRAVAKAGLRLEGVAERYLLVGDEWRDHERYAMTAEEWTARGDELTDAWMR